MKKKRFFFLLLISGWAFFAKPASGGEDPSLSPEQQASMLEYEVVAAKAEETLPRWRSSVGDIEKKAAELMEANTKIAAEHRALNDQIKAAADSIEAQKALNRAHQEELQKRKADISASKNAVGDKLGLTDAERSVAKKRADLSCLQARLSVLENRIRLRQLRLSELDLQQRAMAADTKAPEQLSAKGLKAEIDSLNAILESQLEQEKMIREKMAVLQRDNQPFIAEALAHSSEAASLRQRWASASDQVQRLENQTIKLQEQRALLEKDKSVVRYRELLDQKKALNSRIAKMEDQLSELKKAREAVPERVDELKAEKLSLEKRNQLYLSEIEDLRENIAVLESKVSSLERYQGRDQNSGR